MAIVKSAGFTNTEKLLADLCDKTFLRLWSYPNPFKDDGHELCDLLAVFDNQVFVFFDREGKHFEKSDGDPLLNWQRWHRAVIERQIQTARGAERYLRSGRGIFLDAKCTVPFPLSVPQDSMVIHKFVVAHGAMEACAQAAAENVYGSLAVTYGNALGAPELPFMLNLERTNPIHVLDTHNLPILFQELDTFFDLQLYLEAKLAAILKYEFLMYCGEEDLLAHYYGNFDQAANRHFIGTRDPMVNGVVVGEGEWKGLLDRVEYKNKKEADRASYLWDRLIQLTGQNALDGTLLGDADVLRDRSAIHEMAREPRFHRRALSEAMDRAMRNFPETSERVMRNLSFMPSFHEGKGYVFLQLKVDGVTDYDGDYRPKRRKFLEIACGAAKNKFPQLHTIVGIAIDPPKFSEVVTEDFLLLDCRNWSEEQRAHYEAVNAGLDFFRSPSLTERKISVQNFPGSPNADPASGANDK